MKKALKIIWTFFVISFIAHSFVFAGLFDNLNIDKIQDSVKKVEKVVDTYKAIDRAAEPITSADEYSIGRTVSANILQTYKVYTASPRAISYVNKICKAITMNSDTPYIYKDYCVAIIDSDEINAFSTCGGHIFITTGILRCAKSEDELAAIIAHEIAHIQLQHAVGAIKADRTSNAISKSVDLTSEALKEYNNLSDDSKGTIDFLSNANNAAMDAIMGSGYSKVQEFQADEKALILLNDSGYEPVALIDALEMINEKNDNSEKGWSKTHPKPKDRIKKAKASLVKIKFNGKSRDVRQARFDSNLKGI